MRDVKQMMSSEHDSHHTRKFTQAVVIAHDWGHHYFITDEGGGL